MVDKIIRIGQIIMWVVLTFFGLLVAYIGINLFVKGNNETQNVEEVQLDIESVKQVVIDEMYERHNVNAGILNSEEFIKHDIFSDKVTKYFYDLITDDKEKFSVSYELDSKEIYDNYIPKDFDNYVLDKANKVLNSISEIKVEEIKIKGLYSQSNWNISSSKEDYASSKDYIINLELQFDMANKENIINKIQEITDSLDDAKINFYAGFKINGHRFYLGNEKERVSKEKIEKFYNYD